MDDGFARARELEAELRAQLTTARSKMLLDQLMAALTRPPLAPPADNLALETFYLTLQETGETRMLIGWDELSRRSGVKVHSLRVLFSRNKDTVSRILRIDGAERLCTISRPRRRATKAERDAQDDRATAPPEPKDRRKFTSAQRFEN